METQEFLYGLNSMNDSYHSHSSDLVQVQVKSDEVEYNEVVNDLDLLLEEINIRLAISRLVSDSVIKGMVCAVEQDANEKLAQKEVELGRLREMLYNCNIREEKHESYQYSTKIHETKEGGGHVELGNLHKYLGNNQLTAKEQLRKIKKEIDKVKRSSPIKRKGSATELTGLSGILQEEFPEKWTNMEKMIDGLTRTLDTVFRQVEDMVKLSKLSLLEWKQEGEFQAKIENMVFSNCLRCFQDEFEKRLWDQNAHSCGSEIAFHMEKIKEMSSLREDLDVISKSLAASESGLLLSHGSWEHRKGSSNHASATISPWEGNGKHDDTIIIKPENIDQQLHYFDRDELGNYFKTEMTKMKRQHESIVQELTEECYSLKREYLRERKKDKGLDIARKKIPDLILKLDNILTETEKYPAFSSNPDSLDILKSRLDFLLSENHQLRNLLMEKKVEITLLSLQVHEAMEKLEAQTVSEANLSRTITNLKSDIEDSTIECSLCDDIYRFLLQEAMSKIKCDVRESVTINGLVDGLKEVSLTGCAGSTTLVDKLGFEDSDMEPFISQGLRELFFTEAFNKAEEKYSTLKLAYDKEKMLRLSLEKEAFEKEDELKLKVGEKEKLETEMYVLKVIVDEKENSLQEATEKLAQEKQKLDLASQELVCLRTQTNQQQILISISNEETQVTKHNLNEALEKIGIYEEEISVLKHSLKEMSDKLREATEEKTALLVLLQRKEDLMLVAQTRENEQRKQMESMVVLVHGFSELLNDLKDRMTDKIDKHKLRLECLYDQYFTLKQEANALKTTGLSYKQRLERKSSDLQKAEVEVDLLGDEVDALLSLLEKIYIALDHYSPILQHYPGIIEILKMVRRELSGDSIKPALIPSELG